MTHNDQSHLKPITYSNNQKIVSFKQKQKKNGLASNSWILKFDWSSGH